MTTRETATDTAADPLLRYRDRFPSLAKLKHFISHSLGAMPAGAYDALRDFGDAWVNDSIRAWDDWLPMVTEAGDRIGRIIGAPPGTIVMHTNVSSMMGIIASCLDFKERDKVVLTELNFPSIGYAWKEQERHGARTHFVPSHDGITVETENFIAAIDEETAVVVLELVLYSSGFLQDAKAITEAAHAKGAIVVIDAYQATGTVPVDVLDIGCDFYLGGSVKWLCGGPGAAYMYVREDLTTRYEPILTGWLSHRAPFAFEPPRIDYRNDVMRYLGGTPSVPALYSSRAGHEIVGEIGVEAIRAKSLRQTTRLFELADEQGFEVKTPREPERRGGMICIDFEGSEPVHRELLKRGYMLDHRPRSGIRLSPHFYTSDAEVEGIMADIATIRDEA